MQQVNLFPQLEKAPQDMNFKDIECPYARRVAEQVAQRAGEGMRKYGVTMARTDIDRIGWINHAIEEALDFACYLMRLKDEYPEK